MKRIIAVLMIMIYIAIMCGCSQESAGNAQKDNDGRISIVTTVFPEYDWVIQVLGDKADGADVKLLLDHGVDLHSYQPTIDDVSGISACDLFIYVGGESDEWVENVLENAANDEMIVINLMETLGDSIKEEEMVEGMQESGLSHDHDEDEEHDQHSGEIEYDEHVWLSLKNAGIICDKIAEALTGLDPDNGDSYAKNADKYARQLDELDLKYREAVENATVKTLLFGDRFPFRYLVDDYGLKYYAAFVGCSAETEASFETIVFLAGKADELKLPVVLRIETGDEKLARTIIENTAAKDQELLVLDSMQAVTMKDIQNGKTYISIMQSNLEVLKKALGL